jgi:hypothetical protein
VPDTPCAAGADRGLEIGQGRAALKKGGPKGVLLEPVDPSEQRAPRHHAAAQNEAPPVVAPASRAVPE